MKRRICCLAICGVIGLLLMAAGLSAQSSEVESPREKARSSAASPPHVMLTVDFGDGAQKRYPAIPWKAAMTVLDTLKWAAEHPHGIDFVQRGQAQTALVTQIDDLKNGAGNEKNWIYRVNDKLADRSCGVFPVQRGDTILWRFEKYQ